MKKTFILALTVAMMAPVFAQKNGNVFSISNHWTKMIGYSYQPGYPYGFSLAGGSFLSVGFADENNEYTISATEKRETTWSMRFGWIGYSFDEDVTGWGAITFRPMLVMGFDKAKDNLYDAATNTWNKESNTYFTIAPTFVVNVYMVHFSVGYEIVPKFKQLNGINFGVGISIPSNTKKLEDKIKERTSNNRKLL